MLQKPEETTKTKPRASPGSVLTRPGESCEPVHEFLQAGVIGQRLPRVRQHLTHSGQQRRALAVHGVHVRFNEPSGPP